MKTSIKLKTLVSFSFLIFLFPFLQTCSDKKLEELPIRKIEVNEVNKSKNVKTLNFSSNITETLKNNERRNKEFEEVKKESTLNFYELLYLTFGETNLKSMFGDKTFYPLLGFLLILLNSILILSFSFLDNFKLTYKLGVLNFGILILSTLGLIITEIVENFNQIKIGYYLFALNSIFILLIAKRLSEQRNYG